MIIVLAASAGRQDAKGTSKSLGPSVRQAGTARSP